MDAELSTVVPSLPKFDLSDVSMCRNIDVAFAEKAERDRPGSAENDRISQQDLLVSAVGHPDVPVRVYTPRGLDGPAPGLLFMHGGAFCLGDLDSGDQRCHYLAEGVDCVVVSVDYRLAPENPFPAGLNDCWNVLLWMVGNADELSLDSSHMTVGGSSAGGCLAAAVSLMARDRGGPRQKFQLLLFPVTDHRMRTPSIASCTDTPVWDSPGCEMMWHHYLAGQDRSENVSPYASPALAHHQNLPPAYILSAELDPLRDEGIEYGISLLEAGTPAEIHQIRGAYHAFDVVAPSAAIARRAVADQIFVLRRALTDGV